MWSTIPRPILALAPMAGYTDTSYRQLVKELCPEVICFTEFTSVDGLLHGNDATMRQVAFNAAVERPIVAQIFGRKPENFYKATKLLVDLRVDAIDINMGCPAKKIVSSDHGSALLKNPRLSEEITRATVEAAGSVPVSVKMRIGTSCYDPDYFFRLALSLQSAGAKMFTIHGRTSSQMYAGHADWQPIYELKKLVSVPVIGNGDVKNAGDAAEKIGNLDGIMVGRGSFGAPWIFREIRSGRPLPPLSWSQKLEIIRRHIALSIEFKGEKFGILEMRKHFAWYVRGLPNASQLRQKLIRVESAQEAMSILSSEGCESDQSAKVTEEDLVAR